MSRTKRVWSDEEISYLREHYPIDPATDISTALHLSAGTITRKAAELGLSKSPDFSSKKFYGRYVKNYKNNINKIK